MPVVRRRFVVAHALGLEQEPRGHGVGQTALVEVVPEPRGRLPQLTFRSSVFRTSPVPDAPDISLYATGPLGFGARKRLELFQQKKAFREDPKRSLDFSNDDQ